MASSRVMPSSSSAEKSGLARPRPMNSIYRVAAAAGTADPDPPPNSVGADFPAGSANMDDLLRNFYAEAEAQIPPPLPARDGVGKTAEEVWKEIAAAAAAAASGRAAAGGDGPHPPAAYGAMTLEDFLSRAGAVAGEDVRVPPSTPVPAGFGIDRVMADPFVQEHRLVAENPILGFGNGVDGGSGVVGGGRGWKRAMVDPVDKAVLRRQKRMIKNRESAARSREKKQAYTVELESLVMRLEAENASLMRELEEHHKMKLQHLVENVIPVTEMKKSPRVLRRTHSM